MPSAVPVWSIYERHTGIEQQRDRWKAAQHRRAVLEYQDEKLANILEAGGIKAKCGRLKMVGTVSGCVKEIINYRSICFLPSVAKRKRGAMLRDLIYWQQNTPGARFTRYMVVTNGQLIPIEELGEAIKKFNRKISKYAKVMRDEFGMDFVFRGLEFPVKPGGKVHLHANLLFLPTQRLAAGRWSAFLAATHKTFKTVLKDAGVLRNPREALKYPFKPNDLAACTDAQVCALAEQLFRSRIVEALGNFKAFRAELRGNKTRTVWDGNEVVIAKCRERDASQIPDDDVKPVAKSNRLVGILPPMPMFSQFAEPILLIEGDVRTVFDTDESLRATCLEFQDWWRANGAPKVTFNLDNRTLSVLERPPDKSQIGLFESDIETTLSVQSA